LQENDHWKVYVKTLKSSEEVFTFDHVIVASGFFGKPILWPATVKQPKRLIHSSKYRDLKGLLALRDDEPPGKRGSNIVVVGGQMSGVEVAASIA
jgi:cation diffusion facilitator CzcD-associated flavoprotein CzcO